MDRSRQRRQLQTFDPSDESLLARVGAATAEDIDTAVKAARAAFDDGPWPNLAGAERAAVLRRIAQGIRGRQRELAELEVRDNGKPLPEALWDIDDTAGCFDFYADLAERLDTNRERQIALADERFSAVARREPVGVAGAIILELPDADGFLEGRTGTGRRLLHGPQAFGADPAERLAPG